MSNVRVRVETGPEWERAILALGIAQKDAPIKFQHTLNNVSNAAILRARANALAIPTHGKKHRGTRAVMAGGVGKHRTKRGFRITTSMPPGMAMLPRGFESQWKHPVYGGPAWVIQHSHVPWFTDAMQGMVVPAIHGLARDMDNIANDVVRMTDGR